MQPITYLGDDLACDGVIGCVIDLADEQRFNEMQDHFPAWKSLEFFVKLRADVGGICFHMNEECYSVVK